MEIEGFNNYTISEDGKVWSKKRKKYLKGSKNNYGYLRVILSKDGKQKSFSIHRLIALAYIDNPENKETVDHIDRDILNNNVNNLRWATMEEQNRNRSVFSNTGFKYISITNINSYKYYRVYKTKIFDYKLSCNKWTLEEAVEIRDCLCRKHNVPVLEWID